MSGRRVIKKECDFNRANRVLRLGPVARNSRVEIKTFRDDIRSIGVRWAKDYDNLVKSRNARIQELVDRMRLSGQGDMQIGVHLGKIFHALKMVNTSSFESFYDQCCEIVKFDFPKKGLYADMPPLMK